MIPCYAFALPDGFVYLKDVDATIVQEMRYHGYHNFVGVPVRGYEKPECILTKQAADALKNAQKEAKKQGLSIKVYDCFRPQTAVDHFSEWASDYKNTKTKAEFYVDEPKETLFKKGFIAHKSGHSRGSTVDLTLIPADNPKQEIFIPYENLRNCELPAEKRFKDNSIDMGTGFDCFSALSATLNPAIPEKQMKNRLILKRIMEKQGFYNYDQEWWHYTLNNEPFPKTYYDFPVK